MAYDLFGAAKYKETNSWSDESGNSHTEYSYYDADGNKLGVALIDENSSTNQDGNEITITNKVYNDTNWQFLGSEWSDGNNNEIKKVESTDIINGTDVDLDGDGNSDFSGENNIKAIFGTFTDTHLDENQQTITENGGFTLYYENGEDLNGDGFDYGFLGEIREFDDSSSQSNDTKPPAPIYSNISYIDGEDDNSDFSYNGVGDSIVFSFNEKLDGYKEATISDSNEGSQSSANLGKATFEVNGSDIILHIAEDSVLEKGDIVTFTGVMDLAGNVADNIEFTI